jgi:hypothetical protein
MMPRGSVNAAAIGCLLAVAGAVAAASPAHASCGDWLEGHAASPARFLTDASRLDRSAAPRPDRAPCDGPSCSRRSPAPPAAPAGPSHDVSIERWCGLAAASFSAPAAPCGVVLTCEPRVETIVSARLERPPRLLSAGRS